MEGHKGETEEDLQRRMDVLTNKGKAFGVKWIWNLSHLTVLHHVQYLH